ncbi:hypothetical protein ACVBKF_00230 [Shewanella sp. 0m-11]
MTPDMTIWIGGAATILAAFIGGIVALTSTVIAKEQRISEFRQAWIDAFRNDIVDLIACGTKVASLTSLTEVNPNKHAENSFKARAHYFTLAARINLRFNSGDGLELMRSINRTNKIDTQNINTSLINQMTTINGEIMELSQQIISTEWENIKKGGLLSRFFISSGKVLITAALTALFVLIASAHFPQYCQTIG